MLCSPSLVMLSACSMTVSKGYNWRPDYILSILFCHGWEHQEKSRKWKPTLNLTLYLTFPTRPDITPIAGDCKRHNLTYHFILTQQLSWFHIKFRKFHSYLSFFKCPCEKWEIHCRLGRKTICVNIKMHGVSGPKETFAVMSVPFLLLWIKVTAFEHSIRHLESVWNIHVVDECNDDEESIDVPISIISNLIRNCILNKQLHLFHKTICHWGVNKCVFDL